MDPCCVERLGSFSKFCGPVYDASDVALAFCSCKQYPAWRHDLWQVDVTTCLVTLSNAAGALRTNAHPGAVQLIGEP
jgi:hypothetical protein